MKNIVSLILMVLCLSVSAQKVVKDKNKFHTFDGEYIMNNDEWETYKKDTEAKTPNKIITYNVVKEEKKGKKVTYFYEIAVANKPKENTKTNNLTVTPTKTTFGSGMYSKFIGQPLPLAKLKKYEGGEFDLASLKGKPAIINLWFTTCKPCMEEIPTFNEIKKNNPDVQFVAIALDDKAKLDAFYKKIPYDFIQLMDAKDYDTLITNFYPTTLFVDKDGIVQTVINSLPKQEDGSLDTLPFIEAMIKIKN